MPSRKARTEYISPILLVEKANSEYRKILNLKRFNVCVEYCHFKMENLKTVCALINRGSLMSSIDLRKAYYSVSISENSRKFLRFEWYNKLYQYRALPDELDSGPRIFSGIIRELFTELRRRSIACVYYLDDSVIVAETEELCLQHTKFALDILSKAGFFCVHYDKSVLQPANIYT